VFVLRTIHGVSPLKTVNGTLPACEATFKWQQVLIISEAWYGCMDSKWPYLRDDVNEQGDEGQP
jgi:hypothetical protein